ncbi:MAG: Holliday junction DNA helicase RuvB C-terminal domain-containing protein [Azonexus sp.]
MSDLNAIKQRVNNAFSTFIANEEAVACISRSLVYAIATAPEGGLPSMSKVFLLYGPPSVGKTELAKRITSVLGVPFIRLDGRGLRSREKLFDMVDEALIAHKPPLARKNCGEISGVPVFEYPEFSVFIDEIHLVPERTQEALLTLLEADDRSLLLDGERGRRVVVANHAAFIFATTKPADLDRAFRSRCIEVQLRKYSIEEISQMVHQRFRQLPDSAIEKIAACSRLLPRVAFMMAQETLEEIFVSEDGDIRAAVRRVMLGRGIKYANGITAEDHRYLEMLARENRPIGERAMQAQLYEIDAQRIIGDIEPFLLSLGFIRVTSQGRQITLSGQNFLKDARELTNRA